jgi:Tfp pilus assembly protein PilF
MNTYTEYIEQLIQLAEDAMDFGKYEEAKRLLDNGLMEEPGYARLHAAMGDLYWCHLHNLELAERHYHLAIRFDPQFASVYRELSLMYVKHRKFKGLKLLMYSALKSEGLEKAFIYEKLALVEESEGNHKGAIQLYRKALLASMDNEDVEELKKHIRRIKYKRLKLRWKKADPA